MYVKDEVLSMLEPYIILEGYRGSIAHGTYQETITEDDKDIMGVFVEPPDYIFGLKRIETVERMISEKVNTGKIIVWDIVYYSLKKYLSLVAKQNPNVLSLLWLPDRHILKCTELGKQLLAAKQSLASKQAYHSFVGYAYGQLHRMKNPDQTGKLGQKRKELIARFGYDVKNASHLIRLLKMGIEFLATGELIVERPENNLLLEIKRGDWPLQKVEDLADDLFITIDEALIHSKLQNKINTKFVNDLCKAINTSFYREQRWN